jgi:peroxiredoxin
VASERPSLALFIALALAMSPGVGACRAEAPREPTALAGALARPVDDGAARHLVGMTLSDVALPSLRSTAGRRVNLGTLVAPRLIVYAYPMTARPGVAQPAGWSDIPGARGCTPETCAFRDHRSELAKLGAEVFGLSTQSTEYQSEMVERLHVPFEVLSDEQLALALALGLPTFTAGGMTLLKRLTFVVRDHRIEHVFYPVFPPEAHADEVIAWLVEHPL